MEHDARKNERGKEERDARGGKKKRGEIVLTRRPLKAN